jgi:6-phosphogluconolactonase
MKKSLLPVLIPLLLAVRADAQPIPANAIRIYVGTYTGDGSSKGIYRLLLDPATASVRSDGVPTETVSPSFLAINKDGTRLFAVNETGDSATDAAGAVTSFSVDPATGALSLLSKTSSAGPAPCHLSLDKEEKNVLVANYWGGSVTIFPVQADGRLGAPSSHVRHVGENPTPRDPGPHAHAVHVDPSNRFALVADLGLDKLYVYPYDAARGTLGGPEVQVPLAKGAGPRHLTFDPDGKTVYVLNELNGTVTAFAFEAKDGSLRELQTIGTLAKDYKGPNSSAEVVVSPDGKFLYASNRGPDNIAIFAIDAQTRKLTLVGHQATGGKHPRNFSIDPSGEFLVVANRDSNNLVVYRIDRATGKLQHATGPVYVPRPACVRMRKAVP